jgi:hypothetical protein
MALGSSVAKTAKCFKRIFEILILRFIIFPYYSGEIGEGYGAVGAIV